MLAKYRDGKVPEATESTALDEAGSRLMDSYAAAMDAFDLKTACERAGALVSEANQYIVATAPWTLAKNEDNAALDRTLASLVRCLVRLAGMTGPFMPSKASELWRALGCSDDLWSVHWGSLIAPQVAGLQTIRPPILFPKPEQANP